MNKSDLPNWKSPKAILMAAGVLAALLILTAAVSDGAAYVADTIGNATGVAMLQNIGSRLRRWVPVRFA